MKIFFLFLGFILFYSCSKQIDIDPDKAELYMNNDYYKAKNFAYQIAKDSFNINMMVSLDKDGWLWNIFLEKIPLQVGRYPINRPELHLLTQITADGDGVSGFWHTIPNLSTDYIELTYYDMNTGFIRGNFQLTFLADSTLHGTMDTVRLHGGTFQTKLLFGH